MINLKSKKTKKEKFSLYPISAWGVEKYGISLEINNMCPESLGFPEGVSLDVEDDEQNNFVGLGIYDPYLKRCWYWSEWKYIKKLPIPKFIAHNGISDIRKLQKWGFKVDESWLLWDTFLMGHILDSSERTYGLRDMSVRHLGIDQPKYEDLTGKKTSKDHTTLDKLPLELVANYNALQCWTTYKLYEKQIEGVRELAPSLHRADSASQYFNQIEAPSAKVFAAMEERGIKVDLEYLKTLKVDLESRLQAAKVPILNDLGNINLDSPKQLLKALQDKEINPILKGKGSTDKRALEKFKGNYLVDLLLKYSEISTLLSSFVYPYLERNEHEIHPHFNQTGTRTGRPSCSNPNLLQIPKRTENGKLVRRMFVSRPGQLFGDIDLGQIEPRIMAHLSKDPVLCQMFNDGTDFHTFTADRLGIDRERAKVLNLSVSYRATHKSVSQQLKCSWETAQKEIDRWWSVFPNLYDWQQGMLYKAKQDGYVITVLGRRIKVDDLDHGNEYRRAGAERQAINNLIQGSAAEIMKLWMIACDKSGINILIQVYDELLIEEQIDKIEYSVNRVKQLLTFCVKLDIPLVAEAGIGKNWDEAKA